MATASLKFTANTASAQGGIKSLEKSLGSLKSNAGSVGGALKKAFLPLAAVTAVAGAGILKASNMLIDFGSNLQDLSDKTGMSVENLVIFGEAFERAGLAITDIQPTLTKMVKTLDDPNDKIVALFDQLGLSMKDIKSMSIEDQFKAITSSIGSMSSQTDKMNALLKIFGKSGVNLMPLVKDADALKNAEKYSKGLAENMKMLAPVLEPLGDAIGGLKTKFLEFISEIAKNHLDEIKKLTDFLNNVKISDFIQQLKTGLEDGSIWATVGTNLKKLLASEEVKNALKFTIDIVKEGGKNLWTGLSPNTQNTILGAGGIWALDKGVSLANKGAELFKNIKAAKDAAQVTVQTTKPAGLFDKASVLMKSKAFTLPALLAAVTGYTVGHIATNELIAKPMIRNNSLQATPYTPSQETLQKRLDEKVKRQSNAAKMAKMAELQADKWENILMPKSRNIPWTNSKFNNPNFDFMSLFSDKDAWKYRKSSKFSHPSFDFMSLFPKPPRNTFGYEDSRFDTTSLMKVGGAKSQMTSNPLVSLHQQTNKIISKMYFEMKKNRKATW